MEILNANLNELKNIILKNAKYQKVMLVYDNTASNVQIMEVYNAVKEDCIFNQISVEGNLDEIYNGYKAIIFLCDADGFLTCNLNLNEFVCVFMPTDHSVLPYFLDENSMLATSKRYLLLEKTNLDAVPICSRFFNNYFNYLNDLVYKDCTSVTFNFDFNEITQTKILNLIFSVPQNFLFFDVKLVKACKLSYSQLPIVDYLLITAFNCLVNSVHNNCYGLVDIYKAVGENYDLLDSYYAMINNSLVFNIIQLNHRCLSIAGQKTSEMILNFINKFDKTEIDHVLNKIKNYSKTSGDLINYLYLYNIFSL